MDAEATKLRIDVYPDFEMLKKVKKEQAHSFFAEARKKRQQENVIDLEDPARSKKENEVVDLDKVQDNPIESSTTDEESLLELGILLPPSLPSPCPPQRVGKGMRLLISMRSRIILTIDE